MMQNRARVRRNEEDSSAGAESTTKYHGLKGRGCRRAVSVGALIALLTLAGWRLRGYASTLVQVNPTNLIKPESIEGAEKSKDWSHCIDNPPQPRLYVEVDTKVEPLWLPAYPTSLPAIPFGDLITALTGVKNGAKNYYRSSPALKRCHNTKSNSNVQAVTCEIVHRK
jgi:hypothetical protein